MQPRPMQQFTYTVGMKLEDAIREICAIAYSHFRNQEKAAESLDISPRTMHSKLKQLEQIEADKKHAEEIRKREEQQWLARARGPHVGQTVATKMQESAPSSAAKSGHGLESAQNTATQQPMPMPK